MIIFFKICRFCLVIIHCYIRALLFKSCDCFHSCSEASRYWGQSSLHHWYNCFASCAWVSSAQCWKWECCRIEEHREYIIYTAGCHLIEAYIIHNLWWEVNVYKAGDKSLTCALFSSLAHFKSDLMRMFPQCFHVYIPTWSFDNAL